MYESILLVLGFVAGFAVARQSKKAELIRERDEADLPVILSTENEEVMEGPPCGSNRKKFDAVMEKAVQQAYRKRGWTSPKRSK
jgi:hypothetical protein